MTQGRYGAISLRFVVWGVSGHPSKPEVVDTPKARYLASIFAVDSVNSAFALLLDGRCRPLLWAPSLFMASYILKD